VAARAASRLRPDCILPSHGSVRGIREIGAPVNYYDSAIGQTGAALKSTLHDIIDGHTVSSLHVGRHRHLGRVQSSRRRRSFIPATPSQNRSSGPVHPESGIANICGRNPSAWSR
jgi:hypothetical protein